MSFASSSDFNVASTFSGMVSNSTRCLLKSELDMVPFAFANRNAMSVKTVICVVNALVEATPISGPAWVYAPAWDSLEMEEPTTLQTPNTNAPFSFASFIAASVSAVSPD